jgi:hypothetical protein
MNEKRKAGVKLLLLSLPFSLPISAVLWFVFYLIFGPGLGTVVLLCGWAVAVAFVLLI